MKRAQLCVLVLLFGWRPCAGQEPPFEELPTRGSDVSVALRFGTPGFGVEVAKLVRSHVAVRVGAQFFRYNLTRTQSDITYSTSLKLHNVSALMDFYPAGRGRFHVTAGIVTNPLTISATGQPASSGYYAINGTLYQSSQVGTLTAEGKFSGVGPYAGLGFGTPASDDNALEFMVDLGAVIGEPTITLAATGAASNPGLAADVRAQQARTQHDVTKFLQVYPVVSVGLAYRFCELVPPADLAPARRIRHEPSRRSGAAG
jgi:hypothetical protein